MQSIRIFPCAIHEPPHPTMVLVHLYILVSLNSLPHQGLFVSTHQYVDERETVFHFPTVRSGIRLNRTVSIYVPPEYFICFSNESLSIHKTFLSANDHGSINFVENLMSLG